MADSTDEPVVGLVAVELGQDGAALALIVDVAEHYVESGRSSFAFALRRKFERSGIVPGVHGRTSRRERARPQRAGERTAWG